MPRYIKRFYKNYMKTRPIKFYLSLSILFFFYGSAYYLFKSFQLELLFQTYILDETIRGFHLDNFILAESGFVRKELDSSFFEEEKLPLVLGFFLNGLSSFFLRHIYLLLKICMFLHLFFTLYSVLFDYLRDYMSITFFLISGLILYYFFFYSIDLINLNLLSKNISLFSLEEDLNLLKKDKELLENYNKINFGLVRLWFTFVCDILKFKVKNLTSLSWHSELF